MARKVVIKKKGKQDPTGTYIAFVAAIIILFSGGSFYFTLKENDRLSTIELPKAITEKRKAVDDLTKTEEKLLLFSRLVGWREEASWRANAKGGWSDDARIKELLNYWVTYLKEKYNNTKYELWSDTAPDNPEKYLTLTKLIDELELLATNNEKEESSLKTDRDATRRENLRKIEEAPRLIETNKNAISSAQTVVQNQEQRIKGIIEQGESDIQSLEQDLKREMKGLINSTQKLEETIALSSTELADYESRLEKIKKKLRVVEEGFEVDGEIIVADSLNGYVYINLGRKDAVMEGLEFEVFNIKQGGLKIRKGLVKILKVYDNSSEATIIGSNSDPQNQIAKDDLVNSDMYSRSQMKNFFFVGKPIGRYSQDELTKKISDFGGNVQQDTTSDINYLVVGEGFDKDPSYDKLIDLGVMLIREKELYSLLGLEW